MSPAAPPPTAGPPRTAHHHPRMRCGPTRNWMPLVLL